jgi:DNA processing protein
MGLYFEGDDSLLEFPCISIVGSRKMTPYGREVIHRLVPDLVKAGLTIVSGLAYGVDAEVHRVMLASGGKGIGVLGGSFDRLYPASHHALYQTMLRSGSLMLTEYPPGTSPRQYHFPARNRIIAAISNVTLLVEAGEKSGSLSTAQAALEANQVVCVIPSDITREGSLGALRLLKQGAIPVATASDILEHYVIPHVHVVESIGCQDCEIGTG